MSVHQSDYGKHSPRHKNSSIGFKFGTKIESSHIQDGIEIKPNRSKGTTTLQHNLRSPPFL